jgi:hypothetical protein
MPFPTAQWGNQGTLGSLGADVYSSLPGPSASTPGSADGPVLGNFSLLADGSAVQFLQAYASTPLNSAMYIQTWQTNYQVRPTTAANQMVVAVNDLSLVAMTTAYSTNFYGCTWFKVKGLAFPLVNATVAANIFVASSTEVGTLAAVVVGTDIQANIVNTVLVGASDAASPCFIQ